MFCCTLLYVHSSFAIILMGKRELVALLSFFSFWCLVIVVWLFLAVHWVCLFPTLSPAVAQAAVHSKVVVLLLLILCLLASPFVGSGNC